MRLLILSFLKIFFRNWRAMFFVILLPAAIFLIAAFLGLERIIKLEMTAEYDAFLLSGVIAFAMMNTGVYTLAYTIIDYRRGQILKRFAVTPLSARQFIIAQTISRFIIALIQTAVLLVLGFWLFHLSFTLNILALPLIVFAGSTIFLNFGFLIASMARDYEEAAPYTSTTGLVLVFLGGVFFPTENLPGGIATAANFLPLKPLSATLRHSLFGVGFPNPPTDLLILLGWLVILYPITFFVFARRIYK